ncbi:MAG: CNNM domain-containing protein [Candidatus Krumholzibacteriia bacterium]
MPAVAASGATPGGAAVGDGSGGHLTLLAAYVLLALLMSFLCSIAEAVLLSVTPSYIEHVRERRPKRAALLQRLKHDNVDRSLAAILTLNTIAHTVGAIGAGAEAAALFGSAWFGLFSFAMTMAILLLSEIIPKTIGAVYWTRLVGPTAYFVLGLIVLLFPIVWLSERLTKLITRGRNVHVFSRDEFVAMARMGHASGQIHDSESRIIRNLFRFGSLKVTDIMTPRTVVSALPEQMTVADALEYVTQHPLSRLPVYRTGLDDITGFVLRDDVLLLMAQDRGGAPLASLKREIPAIPDSVSLGLLLERLLKERQHIAIVIDEYGGTRGLVTLEDVFETLIGIEIVDETDDAEDMRAVARKLWLDRARAMGIEGDFLKGDDAARPLRAPRT